jgi:AGCS family alanine or glycine:cation symporter
MFRLLLTGKVLNQGVSSFQALSMSLAGRVGTECCRCCYSYPFGGPGAMFWMWMVAFGSKYTACHKATLAQIYKEKHLGTVSWGASVYIEELGVKWFAVLFPWFP